MRPGAPTIGGYIIESQLGQGGMGTVYRARHPAVPGKLFALKMLNDPGLGTGSETAVARFQREMEALAAATNHPNVVRIHAGSPGSSAGERPWFVMELVPGKPLSELAGDNPLDPSRAARIVRAVADGVAHCHAQRIIHRDLKPENILVEVLDGEDRPRVCDFGIARFVDATGEKLTKTGVAMGTVGFSAPEQLDGRAKRADERADVYALGGILYHALLGHAPFSGDSHHELLVKVLLEPAPRIRSERPEVPAALEAIVLQALEKEPRLRYRNAAALRDDLDRFLRGEVVQARTGFSMKLRRILARRRLPIALAVVGLVALALVPLAAGPVRRALARRELANGLATERVERLDALLGRLEAEGASGPAVEEAKTKIASRAVLEAASTKSFARLVELLEIIERRGGDAATSTNVREQCLQSVGRESKELLVSLAKKPEGANLVNEPEGRGPPLGEALIAAGLVDEALALANARLAKTPGEPAARALRAFATLAARGGPRRALAPRTSDAVLADAAQLDPLVSDLEAARLVQGAPGARAAWLAVDLLVLAGRTAEAREVARAAKTRAPSEPEGAVLERVLAASGSDDQARLAAKLGDPAASDAAAIELSRLLALRGAPSLLEAPELAAHPSREAAAALAQRTASAYLPAIDDAAFAKGREAFADMPWDAFRQLGKKTYAKDTYRREVLRGLGMAPRHYHGEILASHPEFGRLTDGPFLILAARQTLTALRDLEQLFDREGRGWFRALNFNPHPMTERWETGTGAAACTLYDEHLRDDASTDEFVAVIRRDPVAARELDLALEAARGLRRLECLREDQEALGEGAEGVAVRERLILEAARGLEALARLGGPTVLPFRARLRRIAFPGAAGEALARLDLERMLGAARLASDPRAHLEKHAFAVPDTPNFLLLGACVAAESKETPGGAGVGSPGAGTTNDLALDLYKLGVAWSHELNVEHCTRKGKGWGDQDLASRLDEQRTDLVKWRQFRDTIMERVLEKSRPDWTRDFLPTPEDKRRVKEPYEFKRPK